MKDKYLSIADIASILKVNPWTVYRWIEWYFSDLPKPAGVYFPVYTLKGTYKLFNPDDLHYFIEFRDKLPFGAMSEYNRYRFGKSKLKDERVGQAIRNSKINQRKLCKRK